MRVEHPYAGDGPGVAPAAVDVRGERRPVDADGTFECEDESWLRQFAASHGVDPDDLVYEEDGPPDEITVDDVETIADDVIEARIDAGECPWCDAYEGDAVGQHATRAHPDAWDDYTED